VAKGRRVFTYFSLHVLTTMNYYIYILECSDKSYYTGITNDLTRRVNEHQDGRIEKAYTHTRRPVKLVYSETFIDVKQAIAREKQLKKWNRAKKEALINHREDVLPELSKAYWSL